ncbi:hypothetical protein LY28_02846 [Ruminiclostridium sufflavum DSM 19573]|uniref:Class IIb bacteriocin, lactobin A/cerein 7B family n=1 Tax=Ruminiclostridium sufflavum DSM 19573 TaxID=1121337 RepID=A0A318XUT0_9FIRM|nr:hypothetical protein [Ruminiclostridium sufflavum]PYG86627.1 hypothetical protein LY28_02846 [Ruminiclostridium sufflavum DSM 19573]
MVCELSLHNNNFSELTYSESLEVDGGFAFIIPAGVILAAKIVGAIAAVGVVGAGVYVGYKQTTADLEKKYGE